MQADLRQLRASADPCELAGVPVRVHWRTQRIRDEVRVLVFLVRRTRKLGVAYLLLAQLGERGYEDVIERERALAILALRLLDPYLLVDHDPSAPDRQGLRR